MNLLVDGVFFQLASTGIARVWRSLLERLGRKSGLNVLMLDRGGCPSIEGIQSIAFPAYTWTYTATDSLLIQKICDDCSIDVFSSTYYTTPTRTPQVQLVYDMIPEVLNFNMSARAWKEKQVALSYSSRYACISNTTQRDLLRFYPGIEPNRTRRTYCGIEADVFRQQASRGLPAVQQKIGLDRPYLLLVGSREQHEGYKNAKLLFQALSDDDTAEVDLVCVGGEKVIPADWIALLPERVRAIRIEVSDPELAALYTGAVALVYPSLYEGFGLPVLEAMACGCPVITTHCGSLQEVAGEAALVISGRDRRELQEAIQTVRKPDMRSRLIAAGLERPQHFSWDEMAHHMYELVREAHEERDAPAVQRFHDRWHRLRSIQAEVDIGHD